MLAVMHVKLDVMKRRLGAMAVLAVAFSHPAPADSPAASGTAAPVGVVSEDAAAPQPAPQPAPAPEQSPDDAIKAVSARVEARWQALIDGNFDAAYEFEAPGYRKAVSPESFRSRFGGAAAWKRAVVERVELIGDGNAARVLIQLTYEPRLPTGVEFGPMQRPVKEAWLNKSGQWWHVSK